MELMIEDKLTLVKALSLSYTGRNNTCFKAQMKFTKLKTMCASINSSELDVVITASPNLPDSPKRESDEVQYSVAPKAFQEYIERSKSSPPSRVESSARQSTGSVSAAKQTEIRRNQRAIATRAHNTDRLNGKLRSKLRSFDRHKKVELQYQSGMDWVMAQKGLLFDILMFATSAMMHKSVQASIPFALSLLSHHVAQDVIEEAQAYFQDLCIDKFFQSGEDTEAAPSADDQSLNNWYRRYKDSENWAGIKKLYVYLTCLILHGPEKCRKRDIKKMTEDNKLELLETTGSVIVNILSITKSLFTNFFQCVSTGKWSDFFHCESTYEKWYNDNLEIERRFAERIIPNDAHDLITRAELLLKQGREMIEVMRKIKGSKSELLAVNSRYLRTYELYSKFVGSVAATELRRTPFCLQISGKSKIGKTSFMKVCEIQYANLFGKDKNVESYVRQSADRFWDAFQSNQWSVIFDDVCAHNPSVVVGVDEFHKDILHICNNVPKMAECASLEDKGTKPILCDLIQVTTNIPDLHAGHYFYDTAALFRRLQYRVNLELRPEFVGSDGFLDPQKIPHSDAFPDLWFITIEKAVTRTSPSCPDREMGCWEIMPENVRMNMWQFLNWYRLATQRHVDTQNQFLINMRKLKETCMCSSCGLPMANHPSGVECEILTYQAGEDTELIPFAEMQFPEVNQAFDWSQFIPDWSAWIPSRESIPLEFMLFTMKIFNSLLNKRKVLESAWIIRIYHAMTFLKSYFCAKIVFRMLAQWNMFLGLPCAILFWMVCHPLSILNALGWANEAVIYENLVTSVQLYLAMKVADTAESIRLAGRLAFQSMGGTTKLLLIIGVLTTGVVALMALLRSLFPAEETEQRTVYQGGLNLKPGREPENVWRMHDYKCSALDIPRPSSSLKSGSEDEIVSYFHRFLVRVTFRWTTSDPTKYRVTGGTGIFLGGQEILFPTHFMEKPEGGIEFHSVSVFYAVRHNVVKHGMCRATEHSVRQFDQEMSILSFPAMPAQRAIETAIPGKEMLNYIGPGLRIGRDIEGVLHVDRLKVIRSVYVKNEPHWVAGEGDLAITDRGDCGSILLALTPSGPVLVGVHMWLAILPSRASLAYNMCGRSFGDIISSSVPKLDNLGKVGELVPLHTKSPIQFLDDLDGMQVFGSFTGFRTSTKSRVCETIGAPILKEKYGFVHTHGPPVMKGREVKFLHLQSFRKINASICEYEAELACAVFLDHVLKYSEDWKVYMLTQHDAINGVPGVRFIDRIPMSTSCGFPYKTPKFKKITPIVDGDWTSELVLDDDIQADVDFILDRWAQGKRAMPVFSAALKDEARKFSKIASKSTRVFYGGPVGLILAERMVFSWFTRLVQTNPLVFMQAPGMDATGSQWDLLFRHLNQSENWIAGDMKEFDISMIIQILRMSYKFIIVLSQHLGAEPEHVKMMKAASEDLICPLVDYFGDLVMGTGKNPSGHALTVIINGLVNALYMIWCYIRLHPNSDIANRYQTLRMGEQFFTDVRAIFYGDDNLMNVRSGVEWFNHTAISELLGSRGVIYTMADKDRESVPYISSAEVSFLKRSFRYEEEVCGYVAPLEIDSVRKALMLTIPSKVVSLEKAYADCIVSQNDTMWHHGRKVFEEFQIILNDLIDSLALREYMVRPLLSYDELRARWLLTQDSSENLAWKGLTYQSDSLIEQDQECERCGRCPYRGLDEEDVHPCPMCGGCTFDDPWCINCQEDGYCSCGGLLDHETMVNSNSRVTTIFLVCDSCQKFEYKRVPITKSLAQQHGIPWSEVREL